MAKRKRRKQRSKTPGRTPGGSGQGKNVFKQLTGGPAFGDAKTIKRSEEYLAAFAHFEEWILHGRPEGQLDLSSLPPEHHMMVTYWPEAFETYRHALWAYLERNSALNPWSSAIRSLLTRARKQDASGFSEFVGAIDEAVPRFVEQKRNATQDYLRIRDTTELRERLKLSLRAFVQYYEIDLPMWFLAVLGQSLETQQLTASAFGGPNSATAQGSLIQGAVDALRGTPLERFLAEAYDADLRNAIQHNDYELVIDSDGVEVRSLDGQLSWNGTRLHQCVTGTAQLVEAVQTVAAYVRLVEEPRRRAEFSQAGLVAVLYMGSKGELPHAMIFQLWCFYEMDAAGTWLDDCLVTFEPVDAGREKVKFSEEGFTIGEAISTTALGEEMRRQGWMYVTRLPVAPALGLGYPKVDKIVDRASYEIVGVPDEHLVRVEL